MLFRFLILLTTLVYFPSMGICSDLEVARNVLQRSEVLTKAGQHAEAAALGRQALERQKHAQNFL